VAEPLKTFFDEALVRSLAEDLARAGLRTDGFVAEATAGLDALELTPRAHHIAEAVRRRLPADPAAALRALVSTFGPLHATDELLGVGMAPFRYLPAVLLIGDLGVAAPAEGLWACREVTRRFTAEFCVRPILEAHPEATWAAIDGWVVDPDPHVRRLVSEGLRPRLPWAPRLRALQRDPTPALARLERLVDDPAELVRRSVANHLGDVAKDHPDLAVDTARRWLAADARRERLVRHGLRHLVKQGHAGALAVLGHAGAAVRVEAFVAPARVALGDTVRYTFDLVSTGAAPQSLRVDAVVTFPKARGRTSTKVFTLGTVTLRPGERRAFQGLVRLHAMTTRTHHPGTHAIAVQVNGDRHPGGAFVAE
jgi:3-methyladenine DNA glycosylase AlkC